MQAEKLYVEEPLKKGFTIYSKNNCSYCVKVKKMLMDSQIFFLDINCDGYLSEDKEGFLSFIEERATKRHTTFPMVFKEAGFIGGFTETQEYLDTMLCFDNF